MSVETSLVCSQTKLLNLLSLHIFPVHWTHNFPYSSPIPLTHGPTALFFSVFSKGHSTSGWYNRSQSGSCISLFSHYLLTPLSSMVHFIFDHTGCCLCKEDLVIFHLEKVSDRDRQVITCLLQIQPNVKMRALSAAHELLTCY